MQAYIPFNLPVAALPGHPRSPQGHDGRDIKNRCSAESQPISDHPLRCSGCFAFSRPSVVNTPWFRPGTGGDLPAVLTSETVHSWLTRWYLCLEWVFGKTNKNAGRNSTFCREQKRAVLPKNSRKSGPKSRG